jgi:hypothetical protein
MKYKLTLKQHVFNKVLWSDHEKIERLEKLGFTLNEDKDEANIYHYDNQPLDIEFTTIEQLQTFLKQNGSFTMKTEYDKHDNEINIIELSLEFYYGLFLMREKGLL